ncbi:MAG: D-aminoacyl-tRNA deacylase [Lachnospiraceae bacterium]
MKFIVQRVSSASVTVDEAIIGSITNGFLVLIGVCETDTTDIADKLIKKLLGLRIFSDENKKANLDLKAVDGSLLLISQFTLYADCKKGNRPSFIKAGKPNMASALYDYIISKCREQVACVETGTFGADMQVELVNDGPFTIILDSPEIC